MRHLDELLLWLAHTIVQHFGVQVMQFWTNRVAAPGQPVLELHTTVCQDLLLPQQMVTNHLVGMVAESILEGQYSYSCRLVEEVFPVHQVTLLKRYGLNYCCGYYYSNRAVLSPTNTGRIPFIMVTLLFLQQEPSQRFLVTLGQILEQSLLIAKNRELLRPAIESGPMHVVLTESSPQRSLPPLSELIPKRIDSANLMKSRNPLAGSVDISDKLARRLYIAIDGQKNVGALSVMTRLTALEVSAALRTLLTLQRIQVYEPSGLLVESSLLLSNL